MYLSGNDGINMSENKSRDLYNRAKSLENWINKVNTQLKEPDRSDVLMLVQHLKEQEKSALWIIRYLSATDFLNISSCLWCSSNIDIRIGCTS